MPRTSTRIAGWERLSREEVFAALPWLRVYRDAVRLPSGRIVDDYYVITAPDYAMICAIDGRGRFLLEKLYKYGPGRVVYSLPGGCIDARETPEEAARREFLEETGYRAGALERVGSFRVDSNRGYSTGHFFVTRAIEKVAEPRKDDMEDSEIVFLTEAAVAKAVRSGMIPSISSVALLMMASRPDVWKTPGMRKRGT